MKIDDLTLYIREMIKGFQIPGHDALKMCLLNLPGRQPYPDSGVSISVKQSEGFYSDIFQFWVRALFCFAEDTRAGALLQDTAPFVACRKISPEEYQQSYLTLLHQGVPDEFFKESQSFPATYVELEKRSFSDAYVVLDCHDFKSSVALSDGEYIAYFHRTKDLSLNVSSP